MLRYLVAVQYIPMAVAVTCNLKSAISTDRHTGTHLGFVSIGGQLNVNADRQEHAQSQSLRKQLS